jgi:hypothetical protein
MKRLHFYFLDVWFPTKEEQNGSWGLHSYFLDVLCLTISLCNFLYNFS